MPVMRTYQCPDCEGVFEHLHMRSTEEPPAFCPLCGASTADVQPELSAPHIAKSIGKVADTVYRDMEESSRQRAYLAAEALGESASDMSNMLVTNMRDDAREGETSAPTVNNEVSQAMQAYPGIGGLQSADAAAGYAAATRSGPHANAGVKAMQNVVKQHATNAPRVVRANQTGSYSAPR